MIPRAAGLWLSLLLTPLQAQEDVAGGAAAGQTQSDTIRNMQETLARDPEVADSLAARVLRSPLGGRISSAADPDQRLSDIRKWITDSPESAAQVAVGLARDDAQGSRQFEDALLRNTSRSFQVNPEHVGKSTYGRLKKSSLDSKLMRADEEMSAEERQEILKGMFEGQGNMSNRIITQSEDGKAAAPGAASAAGFSGSYYDRLSRFNLHGYSPRLLAIQNALNQRRAPGAPKLLETGKLDYATLIYPVHGMRYDLRNLEDRMRLQQNRELARRAGRDGRYSPAQLLEPEVEASLQNQAASAPLDPAFGRRRQALERAAAAIRDFTAAADPAQDAQRLSRDLLLSLGAKQKEASRWLTVAALEEELQRLDGEAGFLSPDLLALIDSCPVPEDERSAYKRRGEGYRQALLKIKSNAEAALRRLTSADWQNTVSEVEASLAENTSLRRNLSRNIQDFISVPYRLRSLQTPRPRWKVLLESACGRYLPGTGWGRRWRQELTQQAELRDVFAKIAAGDLEAAHAILAAAAPRP
ncbi:MAG: hypothetical protein WC881_01880 [Elusimicrobiota bacterium]|jgi:hypothetical protein